MKPYLSSAIGTLISCFYLFPVVDQKVIAIGNS